MAWKLHIAPLPYLSLFSSSIWLFLTCTLYKVSKHKYFPEFSKLFQQIIKSKVGVVGTLGLLQLVWSPGGQGLPWWLSWWRIHLQYGRPGFDPWVWKIPWRRERLPTPVFWPGEFHGLSMGVTKSHTAERLSLSLVVKDLWLASEVRAIMWNWAPLTHGICC